METCAPLATTVTMAPTPQLPVPRGRSSTPRAWETSATACSVLQVNNTSTLHLFEIWIILMKLQNQRIFLLYYGFH